MSVELVRIDNRLVHGQVIEAWVPYTHADRIVVIDNAVASDPLKRSILELATPRDIRLDILSVPEAVEAYEARSFEAGHVIVIFAGPREASQAYRAGFGFRRLNVGNVHYADGKTRVSTSVCCDREELELLQELAGEGVEVEVRTLPREAARRIGPNGRTNERRN